MTVGAAPMHLESWPDNQIAAFAYGNEDTLDGQESEPDTRVWHVVMVAIFIYTSWPETA